MSRSGRKVDLGYGGRKARYEWMLAFGHDHAFLCSWFLHLALAAGTAIGLVSLLTLLAGLVPAASLLGRHYPVPAGLEGLGRLPAPAAVVIGIGILALMALFLAAASELGLSMGEVYIYPRWFAAQSRRGIPKHSLLFASGVSVLLSIFGSGALRWLVFDLVLGVLTICGYACVSMYLRAQKTREFPFRILWAAGVAVFALAGLILLAPNPISLSFAEPESYLVLACWCILGFFFYWRTFHLSKDHMSEIRITDGVVLFVLVFFASTMWFLRTVLEGTDDAGIRSMLIRCSAIQLFLVMAGLAALLAVYLSLHRESEELEQEKLQAEERTRAKTRFLSNMAHDIRTPMNAIIGYTNLAMENVSDEERTREYLRKIQLSGDHLLSVVGDVLEMNRIESGQIKLQLFECDLGGMLEDIGTLIADQIRDKKQTLALDYSQVKDKRVYCDKNRFDRILINLLSNSIRFTPEGGHISVKLLQTDEDARGYGHYEFYIKDDGVGMTEEFAARIFDSFESERPTEETGIRGAGLGMAIAKGLLDLMDGMIDVETMPDAGTEFILRVRFPLLEERVDTQKPLPAEVGHDFTGKRILLVDDNLVNREIAKEILKGYGFELEEAVDGQNAVHLVADSKPGYYDLILMDIRMPIMDGYEASRKIRMMKDPVLSSIPIVAMTANAFDEDVRESRAAGMNGHIAKPIDIPKMMGVLEEVFSKIENDKIRAELQY